MEADNIEAEVCRVSDSGTAECDDRKQHEDLLKNIDEAWTREKAAKRRDEILFRQPESTDLGDCPICCVPMPQNVSETTLFSCCNTNVCNGCTYVIWKRQRKERLASGCPFCRQPGVTCKEEDEVMRCRRLAAKDPIELTAMGEIYCYKEKDYEVAFGYYKMAADLGHSSAHCALAWMYNQGRGVEKDKDMEIYHLEEAAIAGSPLARYQLGLYEWNRGRYDRAVRHWIINAKLGDVKSMQKLLDYEDDGVVDKDELIEVTNAHQAVLKEMNSKEREKAAERIETGAWRMAQFRTHMY